MLIYSLFMVELFRSDPIESLDEVIYWVNAVSRVLEFVVALCVVAYGTWESLFGEWSWMGASVIIIHSYFNVWLRAQSGWRSFLLRQEAAKKINSLPRATALQLQQHNDVCSICFQVSVTQCDYECVMGRSSDCFWGGTNKQKILWNPVVAQLIHAGVFTLSELFYKGINSVCYCSMWLLFLILKISSFSCFCFFYSVINNNDKMCL